MGTISSAVETSLPGLAEVPSGTPLCGRDALLMELAGLGTEAAQKGQVRFCLVVGPPGAGKTRLLLELEQSLAARGLRVLRGTADEGGPPLGPFLEILQQRFAIGSRDPAPLARERVLRECQALLPGARGAEVAQLLAELLRLPAEGGPGEGRPRSEPRLYQALRRFLQADAAPGRAAVALLLDEMEHAQPEAVNLLHYLAAGLSSSPVLLCAFARPEINEAHPSFGQGEVPCARIELPPLREADAVDLLDALCRGAGPPPPEVTHHVAQQLGGSPRAIVELVRLLEETGALRPDPPEEAGWDTDRLADLSLPGSLEEIVAERLQIMEPAERAVLEQAATCGEHFFLDAVVALGRASEVGLGLPAGEARGAPDPDGPTLEEIVVAGDRTTQAVKAVLKQLCRRGLVVPLQHSSIRGEREYRFAYPPWRDVIYDAIPPAQRRRYHALLGQWLDLTAEGHREELQEAIGDHFMRAGRGEAAALRYLRAAELARDRYAHGRATRLLARAIACLGTQDLGTRIRLWHELGSLFHLRGDYESALGAYEKVVRLSWVVASRSKAAAALLSMGEIWRQKGELQLSLDYLGQALDLFRQAGDLSGTSDTLDGIGQVQWLLGRYGEALSRSAEALEQRRRIGDRGKIAASLLSIGNIERHRGLFDAAAACYEEALVLQRGRGDKAGAAACLNAIGMLAYQRGDASGARRHWEEALAQAEAVGAQPLVAVLHCHIGDSLLSQGQLGEAEARFLAAERLARELQDRRVLSEAARSLGLIALRRGDTQEAHARCTEALRLAEAAGVQLDIGRALLGLGEVHAATLYDADGTSGRRSEPKALTYFRRAVGLLRELGNPAELMHGLVRMGRYQVECGDIDEGAGLLREAEQLCGELRIDPSPELRELLAEL